MGIIGLMPTFHVTVICASTTLIFHRHAEVYRSLVGTSPSSSTQGNGGRYDSAGYSQTRRHQCLSIPKGRKELVTRQHRDAQGQQKWYRESNIDERQENKKRERGAIK